LDEWQYLDGMVFQASHFADVSDRWGVSFTIFKKEETQ
jgi:predicted 3-demethylubiquinone-9 3-methyltransferase (glyoxalase superfamily)